MIANRNWSQYRPDFRAAEVATLAGWIRAGVSGAVVGLPGSGKSNLLGFLCYRPEVLARVIGTTPRAVAPVPVDLNNLPDHSLATFYRVILRAFAEGGHHLQPELWQVTDRLYERNRAATDAFVTQSALRELLFHFRENDCRVVLVLDGFDDFYREATPAMTNTLRGLRDSFKDTLCYIVGMNQAVAYLPDPAPLGELYELLDIHVCQVGPMSEVDALTMVAQETAVAPHLPQPDEIARWLQLTGGYPSLLKVVCQSWVNQQPVTKPDVWRQSLHHHPGLIYRLRAIWQGLSQEEQWTLVAAGLVDGKRGQRPSQLSQQHKATLERLAARGLIQPTAAGYRLFGTLFADFVQQTAGPAFGRIWLDETTEELYQGERPLVELTPLERTLLLFLVRQPHIHHRKSTLIAAAWPQVEPGEISDDSLYQVITGLRQKLEPDPAAPSYIVTWRGRPEGGYRFFPEGRPR